MMKKEDDERNDEMMIYTLLPRYLPVTRQEGFDLRGHIESAGHQVNFLIDFGLSMHTEDIYTHKDKSNNLRAHFERFLIRQVVSSIPMQRSQTKLKQKHH